jgi:hypothetical protein
VEAAFDAAVLAAVEAAVDAAVDAVDEPPQPASMVPTIAAVRTRPRIFFFISYPPKIL